MRMEKQEEPSRTWTIIICLTFICFEVLKQTIFYSVRIYYSLHISITQIIFVTELLKFSIIVNCMYHSKVNFQKGWRPPLRFAVPSVLYFITGNIYWYAMGFVSPPILFLLLQMKTVLTAVVYRLVFGRTVTAIQWLSALLIVLSICILKIPDIATTDVTIPAQALLLAMLSATVAVIAAVFTEWLYKNDSRPFLEQQMWIYMYGSLVAGASTWWYNLTISDDVSNVLVILVTMSLISAGSGLLIAVLIQKFDLIMKDGVVALSNIVTAIIISIMFPQQFHMSVYYVASLLTLMLAMFLYKVKHTSAIRQLIGNCWENIV